MLTIGRPPCALRAIIGASGAVENTCGFRSCRNRQNRVGRRRVGSVGRASRVAQTTRVKPLRKQALHRALHHRYPRPIAFLKPHPRAPCLHCIFSGIADTTRAISSESLFASERSLCRAVQRSAILKPTLGEQASLVPAAFLVALARFERAAQAR